MFTGLIAALGTVERLAEGSTSCRLTVRAPRLLSGVKIGDSIAVNGVCLTVVHLRGDIFTADVMPETVRRTTLHLLQPGDRVNLETDILARYVEKMLGMDKKGKGFAGRHQPGAAENTNPEPELTEEFLLKHGF